MNQFPDHPPALIILGLILLVAAVLAIGSHFWPQEGSDYPPLHGEDDSFEGWR